MADINNPKRSNKVITYGLLGGILEGIYCILVAQFFMHAESWFGSADHPPFGAVGLLLLFVVSAVISAVLVLGYPIFLAVHKFYRESFQTLGLTLLTLLVILFIDFFILAIY